MLPGLPQFALVALSLLMVIHFGHGDCPNDPDADSCCQPNLGQLGCDDQACCQIVCSINPFCCNVGWTSTCAITATNHCVLACGDCGSFSAGDCCTPNDTPYCHDEKCCESVCAVDPFCCDAEGGGVWDQSCVDLAWQHCPELDGCQPPACGDAGTGHCCEANGSPWCQSSACCNTVCDIDPACCEVEWDECCAHLATQHCSFLSGCHVPDPPSACGHGDCCVSNESPGCDDGACCNIVCPVDPFCCDEQWDQLCANAAELNCRVCWHGSTPPPLPPNFSCQTNCGGAAVSGCWCDEACCDLGDCCEDKGKHCPGCLFGLGSAEHLFDTCLGSSCEGSTAGSCWCDNSCGPFNDCCPDVCIACPDLGICSSNPSDLTGNGVVDVFDLLELLAHWGECEYERCFVMGPPCKGDFNHDHQVDVLDLLFLLNNWG